MTGLHLVQMVSCVWWWFIGSRHQWRVQWQRPGLSLVIQNRTLKLARKTMSHGTSLSHQKPCAALLPDDAVPCACTMCHDFVQVLLCATVAAYWCVQISSCEPTSGSG